MSSLQIIFIWVAYLCSCAFGIKCPPGFEEYNHACYMVVEDKVDFFSAYRDCKSRKSYLLNVDATPELDFVKRLVGRVGQWDYPGFWIGGFYAPNQGPKGTWFWEKTDAEGRNTVTQLTPDITEVTWWGHNEPMNGVNNWLPEHWLMIKRFDLKLYSEHASKMLGYICETVAE